MRSATRSRLRTIVPSPFAVALGSFALLFLLLGVSAATAQTTLNQTTCVSDTGSCTTGGLLQDLVVNCATPGAEGQVATWLSRITDREGPNRITISGTCNPALSVIGFNRLTIRGTGGAVLRNLFISNSRIVTLQTLTVGPAMGNLIQMTGSSVILDGVTVQNANGGNGINATAQSVLTFGANPSVISGNGLAGIRAAGGSVLTLANVTISNNGAQGGGGLATSSGVAATGGTSITLSSLLGGANAPIDISGHPRAGIALDGGVLSMGTVGGPASIRIHDNGDRGLEMAGGHAILAGQAVKLDGNASGGQQLAIFNGILELGGGAQVQGSLLAAFNANAVIGDTGGTGGPATITGVFELGAGSVAQLLNANSIGALTCDATSWANSDGQSVITSNGCPSTPSVTVNTGVGLSGGGTVPLGGSITLNNTGVLGVGVASPLTSTGGQSPVLGIVPNHFIENGSTPQGSASFNIAGNGTVGGTLNVGAGAFKVDTDGVTIGPGGTAVRQHASATFTLSLPSLKPNTCTNVSQPFAAAGTGTHDTIALGISSAFMSVGGTLMFNAWQSAPNTITIRACNVSPMDRRLAR